MPDNIITGAYPGKENYRVHLSVLHKRRAVSIKSPPCVVTEGKILFSVYIIRTSSRTADRAA